MKETSDTDRTLAVQTLFVTHTGTIRAFIYGLVGDRCRTDDVLQESFLAVTKLAARFEHGTNFPKWACSIARYKVLEARRAWAKDDGLLSIEAMEALAASEAAYDCQDPRVEYVRECLTGLAPTTRQAVTLRYEGDHKPGEIATILGWTPEAVYVALSKARAVLRECVERKMREQSPT